MKVIGIIGGMGPEATAQLFYNITKATPAKTDKEHHKVIVYSNPQVPDRTKAILEGGESPLPAIIETGIRLQEMGVTIAGIPCITSHYYIKEIQAALSYPIVNSIEELQESIKTHYPHVAKVGLLATTGTLKSKLFERYFTSHQVIQPTNGVQGEVMDAIYGDLGIKSGNTGEYPKNILVQAGQHLINAGAQALITGCTEIPLVLDSTCFAVPLLDPMDALVQALLRPN